MHLYFHIPFCKQACYYCDFHFSTNLTSKEKFVKAISKEIELQKDYLMDKNLTSIYFGGGTPSLLSNDELASILNTVSRYYRIDKQAEITLEVNPDDITISRLKAWKDLGINRLSIGIQSFENAQLKYLNRAHNAQESKQCIKDALQVGFENMTIDLIFAIPSENNDIWKDNLNFAIEFQLNHISSYCLTIEEKTVFGHRLKQNLMEPIDDEFASNQFHILMEMTSKNAYEQYEISNFARNENYAIHNTSYWQGEEYLGLGPSAHSYNESSRKWNISNNAKYIKSIESGIVPFEEETLSQKNMANEYLMTGLRTKWGVDLEKLQKIVSIEQFEFQLNLEKFVNLGYISKNNKQLKLTNSGKLKADWISSELFF